MTCDRVKVGGMTAIVCTRQKRRRCFACFLAGGYQCDWKIGPGKTCDRYLCPDHAKEVAPGKHLCPEHQERYTEWLARRAAKAEA